MSDTPTELIPVALYLRFSSEMQRDSNSIAYQDRVGRAWCERNGRVPVAVFIDEAFTASSLNRPGLQDALRQADNPNRGWEEIVVYHTWRFSRAMADAPLFGELEAKGIPVQSATEGIDTKTASGRFQRNISLAVGQYQLDQLSEATTEGKKSVVIHGRTNASRLPYGYARDGTAVVFSAEADVLRQAFTRMASGQYSIRQVAAWITNETGKVMVTDSLTAIFRNRFYCGLVPYRGLTGPRLPDGTRRRAPKASTTWTQGVHTALVDERTFEQVREVMRARVRNKDGRSARADRVYLLARVAVCATCGRALRAKAIYDRGAQLAYFCPGNDRVTQCQASHAPVRQRFLLPALDALMGVLSLPEEYRAMAVELGSSADAAIKNQVTRDRLEGEAKRVRLMFQKGQIEEDWLDRELARIRAELAELELPTTESIDANFDLLATMATAWRSAQDAERADMLRVLLAEVVVDTNAKKVTAFTPRQDFLPMFRASGKLKEGESFRFTLFVLGSPE